MKISLHTSLDVASFTKEHPLFHSHAENLKHVELEVILSQVKHIIEELLQKLNTLHQAHEPNVLPHVS